MIVLRKKPYISRPVVHNQGLSCMHWLLLSTSQQSYNRSQPRQYLSQLFWKRNYKLFLMLKYFIWSGPFQGRSIVYEFYVLSFDSFLIYRLRTQQSTLNCKSGTKRNKRLNIIVCQSQVVLNNGFAHKSRGLCYLASNVRPLTWSETK